ncbi:MAG: hypothetical protein ABJO02_03360 [Reichenbachiella sp.]|uniref:hypothetical protein n=1 Tax=Reichenbachiella sp. TaxID=2184521 RepID=UPI00329A16BD
MSRYQNNYRQDRNQKKHSGAKEKQCKNGALGIFAWNYSRNRGLISVKGFTNSKSTESESERGNKFVTIMLECFYKNSGNRVLELVNYNKTTGKAYLEKLGMVISTKAPNGGYFGQIKSM